MKQLKIYIYWPNGNTTAIVEKSIPRELQAGIAQKIINNENLVEQVIFLEKPISKKALARLQMMGDEFSGNAALVFGYYLLKKYNKKSVIFESSGIDKLIKANINQKQQIESEIPINLNLNKIKEKDFYWTIPLPGIFQIIIPMTNFRTSGILSIKNKLIKKYQDNKKAIGLIFVNKPSTTDLYPSLLRYCSQGPSVVLGKNKYLKINPFIWVKETKTLINETACGSGSIAASLWQFLITKKQVKDLPIVQPTNKKIFVSLKVKDNKVKSASLKSKVKFLKEKIITLN